MAEEKKNEKMQAKDLGSLIPGFLGFGAQIAGAVPGLRKPKRTNAAEGAVLAATTGAARAAAGAGSAGYGATRGLSVREAGRQAQQVLLSAAPGIAQAANADEIRYQQDLNLRNERIANFGTMLGAGLSTLGAGVGTMVDEKRAPAAAPGFAPTGYPGAAPPPQQDPQTGMVMGTPQEAPQQAPTPEQAGVVSAPPAQQGPGPEQGDAVAAPPVMTPEQAEQAVTSAALEEAMGKAPNYVAQGNQTIAGMVYEYAKREGLDPVMTAAHIGKYMNDPYANPAARISPYNKAY